MLSSLPPPKLDPKNQGERTTVSAALEQATGLLRAVHEEEEQLRVAVGAASSAKLAGLLSTSQAQQMARRYEELAAGTYRPQVDPSAVDSELARAAEQREALVGFVQRLYELPRLEPALERIQAILSV